MIEIDLVWRNKFLFTSSSHEIFCYCSVHDQTPAFSFLNQNLENSFLSEERN